METTELDDKVRAAAASLEEHGYAVIERLFSDEECDDLIDRMWQLLEKASGGKLRRDLDYGKVRANELPPHKHGILESYRLNHADFIRGVRRDPRLIRVFALLYGTDQLVASQDRVNWKFPGRAYTSSGPWCHADQHPSRAGRLYVQSYLTLTETRADSPGNQFYRGSHAIFADFFAAQKDRGDVNDWTKLTDDQRTRLAALCPLVKPACPRGSLVLWDSRTVHSPSEGTDFTDGRFVVYACYCPLWERANDFALLDKKRAAFEEMRASSHVPVPQKLFAKYARAWGKPQDQVLREIDPALLGTKDATPTERLLYGFDRYLGAEGRLLTGWEKREPLLQFESPFAQPVVKKESKKRASPERGGGSARKKRKTARK